MFYRFFTAVAIFGLLSVGTVLAQQSDIIVQAAYSYPTNIPYDTHQESTNIVNNNGQSILVAGFTVRDGGASAPDAGGASTTVTAMTFDLGTNWAIIRRIELRQGDDSAPIAGTTNEQNVTGQTVSFSGLTGLVANDNSTVNFQVRVSFQDPVTDNLQFSITITAATATGSTFAASDAGGATTSTAGDNNRIEVLATKLLFVQGPSTVTVNTTMSPAVTIEAVDALDNRDLDNTSSIAVTSTGTLTGTPVTVVAASGLSTFSTLTHTVVQPGRTLSATATTPSLTGVGPSSAFNVAAGSLISDIAPSSFTHPSNIAYDTHQEATDIVNSATSIIATKFDLRDGGASASDGDVLTTQLTALTLDLGTNFGVIRRIALYDAAGTTELTGTLNDQAVSAQLVSFTGLTLSAGDNAATTFSVRVSFADPVTDNLQFSFTVNSATANPAGSIFAAANAGGAVSSTATDDNRIEVTATKLLFVQQPSNGFINVNMSPAVTIEAVDALDNRDLDNASSVAVTSTGTLTGSPVTVSASSGLATFGGLQHSAGGTGLTLSATATSPALTGVGPSSTFFISAGSDIIANTGFTYLNNIAYNTSQEASDIVNSATSRVVAQFDIRDGGGINDPGTNTTVMTALTLDLGTNWSLIRRIAVFNAAGTTQAAGTSEVAVSGQTVNFTGMSGAVVTAADNGTTTFSIRVSFQDPVTDNLQFSLTVTAATATGSPFGSANAGGATTSTAGDNNRIEVTATRLLFAQGPSNVEANAAMSPDVTIEAVDALDNRDLDNGSTIAVTSTGTLTGTPVTLAATSGLATFSTLTHTVAQTGRTLSATATSPALTAVGPSPTFNVTGTSDIIANTGFTYTSNIPYDNYQEATDIVNSGTSLVVAQFDLRDGSGAADADALPTILTGLTLNLGANFGVIRRIALFDAAGTTQLTGTSEVVGGATAVFSGLSLSAPDGGTTSFTVRASFADPITDNLQFSLTVTGATSQAANSQFTLPTAGGAVTSTTGDINRIEVTATKLLFVQQPSNAFINVNMSPAVTIEAVDALDNRDLDNTSSVAVTSTGTLTGTPVTVSAASGLASFGGLQHSAAGTGLTLSATATSPALTGVGPSSTFFISAGSDIIVNSGFTIPTNIPYASHQAADIVNSGTSIVVARFDVRDGGGVNDPGGSATTVTNITLDMGPNFAMFRRIALFNAAGTTQLGGTSEVAGGTQFPAFSGALGLAATDDGTVSFSVRVSFLTTVTDNTQFSVGINAATATGSTFAAANAGGAVTSTAGDNNRIEVTATKLLFVQQPPATVFQGSAMTPAVTIESVDANDNRDLDNTSNITLTSTGTPNSQGSVAAVAGLATFPAVSHSALATGRTLSGDDGGPLTATGNSSTFDVVAPGSDIIVNAAFTYPTNIPYDQHQAPANIVNSATSLVVAKFDIRDGSGTTDGDALATTMTNLTLDLGPNFALIRRIALYDGTGTTELTGTNEQAVSSQTVAFSGLSIAAPDNGTITFSVRVSFQDPVTDNLQFSFTVTSATATGSVFSSASAGSATTSVTGDNNRIEVTATKLLFATEPTDAYINTAMALTTVEAVDALDNRDLDNGSSVSITSSGTLTGSPVSATASSGLASFSTLAHSVAGSGLTLSATATGPALTASPSSAPFDIFPPSNASNIIANTGFAYPSNIPYDTHQEASNIINSGTSLVVAKFDVQDGGGAADGDPFPTVMTNLSLDLGPNFAYIRRIALYDAAGTTELTGTNEQAVSSQIVSFSGLNISAADNGSTTFSVRVSFNDPVIDNQQISFTVSNTATQTINSAFTTATAGGAVSSTALDNNRIEVTATKLLFVQGPTSTFANLNMSPAVTVEAVDALDNRDLDNTSTVSITSTGTLTGAPVNSGAVNGLASFSTLVHTVAGAGLTLTATSTGPVLTTTGASTTFGISDGSDIAVNTGFVYPSNIAYDNFQESINITSGPSSLVAAQFILRDGGVAPVDPDALPTVLTNLTLDLGPNFSLIRRISLFDGAGTTELTTIGINEQTVGGQLVSFSGLSLAAGDDSSIPFSVRVSFNAPVTDNLQFSFTVTSATASGIGSAFANASAGGASTSTAGDNNRVEVTATRLQFLQGPSNTFINVSMSPAVTVESVDILGSRDLDNASSISMTSTGTLTGSPVVVAAINGLATFSTLAHSVSQLGRTLSATASGPVLVGTGASSTFTVLPPSSVSNIIANTSFIYNSNIAYNNFQEATDIVNSGTSLNVARFDVQDGGGAADPDNFPTVLTNLTLDLGTNFGLIRRIALFDAAGTTQLTGVAEQAVAAQLVAFSGLTLTAPDNGNISFTVRVSFQDPVTDNQQFSITVNSATAQAINSTFQFPNAGGAVSSTTLDINRIEVTATKLLFVQGPTNAFINVAMTPSVTVEATDPLDNRDLDNASSISITSTGTLTGSPVVVGAINGLATFPGLSHSVAQAGRTISATSTLPVLTTTGPSSTFSILAPIATSNIIVNAGFTIPTNIPYHSHQEASDIVNSGTSIEVARFDIQDGGGSPDADAFPTVLTNLTLDLGTNFGLIRRIALFDAAGTTQLTGVSEQAVSTQLVSFSGLNVSAPDNGSISFTVRVSFNASVTDNLQFSIAINNTATVATNSAFAAANAGGAVTPTTGDNNRIEVTATLLFFTQDLTSPLLPVKNINLQQLVPVARAQDALSNVDVDYVSAATINTALTVSPSIFITPVSGVFTFNTAFQYLQTGNGTITLTAPGLTSVISNPVVVQPGVATTITGPAGAPATISSLATTLGGNVAVFSFNVNDDPGGTPANQNDGLPTLISQIVINENTANDNIADWSQVLADAVSGGAVLTDGTNTMFASAIGTNSITFGGIPNGSNTQLGWIDDNASKTYTLRIFLRSNMSPALKATIDGRRFEFQISQISTSSNITLAANSTAILLTPLQTVTSGTNNQVSVLATALNFTSPTVATFASLNTDYSGVALEAIDANGNRDLGYNGVVREVSNFTTGSAGMLNQPVVNTDAFASGLLGFASNFRFVSGANGNNVALTVKSGAGPGVVCGVNNIICGTSPTITIQSANESRVKGDPAYTFSTNIGYINYQATGTTPGIAPADILSGTGSYEIGRILLSDGDADFISNDFDASATTMTSITLRIANAVDASTLGHIRNIALYNSGFAGATEIAELVVTPGDVTAGQITFSGLNIVAPDDGTTIVSVRVSFNNTAATIIDKTLLRMSVVNATAGAGSQFRTGSGELAGVPLPGLQAPLGVNLADVVATTLDFTTDPAPFAGVNESVAAGVVQARDANAIVDTDFNAITATVSSQTPNPASVNGTFTFVAGELNMGGLIQYGSVGNGTLNVSAGGLNSPTVGPNACDHVDVISVVGTRFDGGLGGVPAGPGNASTLQAGTQGQAIFGIRFQSAYNITSPTSEPRMTSFTIDFSVPFGATFLNPRIIESLSGTYDPLAQDIVTAGTAAPLTIGTTTITASFITPRDFNASPINGYTYFLVADVSSLVNGSTPPIQVSVVDNGSGTATQSNIVVANQGPFVVGSQTATVQSDTYNFASIQPPTLVSSYPYLGQDNVDATQSIIELTFTVPVFTLDGVIKLTEDINGTPGPSATLAATDPASIYDLVGTDIPAKPIRFNIPGGFLQPGKRYYITIEPGSFNGIPPTPGTTNKGIMDVNKNVFAGITYSGTLYFRTSDNLAPKLLGGSTIGYAGVNATAGDPSITNLTSHGATLNATFNKTGKAYFMVLRNAAGTPSNAQIKAEATLAGSSGYTPAINVVGAGSFDIVNTTTISEFGTIVPNSGSFTPGATHYVWIYAEATKEKSGPSPTFTPGVTFLPTTAPYGAGPTFAEGTGGPTLTFNAPAAGNNASCTTGPCASTVVTTNNPTITFCSNSYQILNTPIVFYEGTLPTQQFQGVGLQTFNLVLPGGFIFDISTTGSVPNYGTLTLQGADFTGASSISFLSPTVLKISFTNTTNTSRDQIIISNLRILSTGSGTGGIFRLGGLALPTITDGTPVANLRAQDASVVNFDNSYSLGLGFGLSTATPPVETAIPDNALPTMVTLTPYIPNTFDNGPSTFSGQGVTGNTLNLQGVTKDTPFNITITHTDQNGCISQNGVQYVVYDHNLGIKISSTPAVVTLDQGPYCANNANFVIGGAVAAPAPGQVRYINFDNLTVYNLESLSAAIPTSSVAGLTPPIYINPTQFSAVWPPIVNALPIPGTIHTVTGIDYRDYSFSDLTILNANTPYVFDLYKQTTNPNANYGVIAGVNQSGTFYTGGSLGFVEFTGAFRNVSNPAVSIKRRQIIEWYIPSVPIVELVTPYSKLDDNDPLNMPGTGGAMAGPNNPGTMVYCESGGLININGHPAAAAGKSVGNFTILDAANPLIVIYDRNALPTPIIPAGFTDNGNGTAVLDPSATAMRNGYADIKIIYTYKENNSPCTNSGYQIIRITPNPIANFQLSAVLGPNVPTAAAYCVDNSIVFNAGAAPNPSSIAPAPGGTNPNTIANYHWNFGDAQAQAPNVNDVVTMAPVNSFPHTFSIAQNYVVTLTAESNWGCQSVPYTPPVQTNVVGATSRTVTVGGIPNVKARLDGVSITDTFHFFDNGSTVAGTGGIALIEWDFDNPGGGPTFAANASGASVSTTYPLPGKYKFDMKVTSAIGCINTISLQAPPSPPNVLPIPFNNYRDIVVLPRVDLTPPVTIPPTPPGVYVQDFEVTPVTNPSGHGNWQVWGTGATVEEMAAATAPGRMSWEWGAPPAFPPVAPNVMRFNDPATIITNGAGIWKTNLTVNKTPTPPLPAGRWYSDLEKSALYSPSFNLASLTRPMISFNSAVQLENSDGVVLQFSLDDLNVADPAKVWTTLGQIADGEDWFTAQGLAGKPGDQIGGDFGWSGFTSPATPNVPEGQIAPKHVLDPIGPGASKVVFRFALGGAKTDVTKEGFSLDNFRIGDRTRTILLESFTSTSNSSADEKAENDYVKTFIGGIGTEVVKLNYHLNFPANDPFNQDNPADPSSRALLYNIVSTPRSVLDGEKDPQDRLVSTWGQPLYNLRTLQLAQADIRNIVATPATDGSVSITFDVEAKAISGIQPNTLMHVVLLEKNIPVTALSGTKQSLVKSGETSFEYVVKKMLPSAAGTPITTTIPYLTTVSFGPFVWTPGPTKLYDDPDDLVLAIFLQESTPPYEVFQVELFEPINDPGVVTGLEPILAEQVVVYPNPANREMTIKLPGPLAQAANVELVDQTGRVTLRSSIPEGAQTKTLNVSDLSGGVYIMQIDMGAQGVLTRKKVMVVHRD